MKDLWLRLVAVGFVSCSIVFATAQLGIVEVFAAIPNCCMYGVDCSGKGLRGADQMCCMPTSGQAYCSQLNPYYCRDAC